MWMHLKTYRLWGEASPKRREGRNSPCDRFKSKENQTVWYPAVLGDMVTVSLSDPILKA